MHPDKKVGLALGILLIGITGAFFFRNEAPDTTQEPPVLTDQYSVDQRVGQKPGGPYMPELDSQNRENELGAVPQVPFPSVMSHDLDRPVPDPHQQNRTVAVDGSRVVPLPGPDLGERFVPAIGSGGGMLIGDVARPTVDGSMPRLHSQRHGSPQPAQPLASSKPRFIIHEVVSGDNLSRLAGKYLGSHSKYLTLYEANRDVLKSPDDLYLGMKLKIPQDVQPSRIATAPSESRSTTSTSGGTRSGTAFMKPDRSSLESISGSVRSTRNNLSQTPPPGLPRVTGLDLESDESTLASRSGEASNN